MYYIHPIQSNPACVACFGILEPGSPADDVAEVERLLKKRGHEFPHARYHIAGRSLLPALIRDWSLRLHVKRAWRAACDEYIAARDSISAVGGAPGSGAEAQGDEAEARPAPQGPGADSAAAIPAAPVVVPDDPLVLPRRAFDFPLECDLRHRLRERIGVTVREGAGKPGAQLVSTPVEGYFIGSFTVQLPRAGDVDYMRELEFVERFDPKNVRVRTRSVRGKEGRPPVKISEPIPASAVVKALERLGETRFAEQYPVPPPRLPKGVSVRGLG
jgi:hypothetical protein